MFKFIDKLFDQAAERLAENFCGNLEEVEKNRTLKEIEIPVKQCDFEIFEA